HLL
ncbi:hypothetical protein CP8484711_1308B, partial [Chlamydia psittaci 84-8471/1]